MRIRIQGTPDTVAHAKDRLDTLLREWDQKPTHVTATDTPTSDPTGDGNKAIDPLAITALILSIPSAALAVADIADRITKRRRAEQFLDHAHQLNTQGITITLLTPNDTTEITTLTPDQLLDHNTDT